MTIRGLELLQTLTAEERAVGLRAYDPQAAITQFVLSVANALQLPDAMRAVKLDEQHLFGTPLVSDGHLVFFFVEWYVVVKSNARGGVLSPIFTHTHPFPHACACTRAARCSLRCGSRCTRSCCLAGPRFERWLPRTRSTTS